MIRLLLPLLLFVVLPLTGCAQNDITQYSGPNSAKRIAALPPLGLPRRIAPGILLRSVQLNPSDSRDPRTVLIYLPEKPTQKKLPVVLIASAGSPLFYGNGVEPGSPEHLPYVNAGFAVVSYAMDGDFDEKRDGTSDSALLGAARKFKKADAGVLNAKLALRYALEREPLLDATRVFTVGHSSAATVALMVAIRNPYIRGCVAYAPACNVSLRLSDGAATLEQAMPGFNRFISRNDPMQNVAAIRCPIFVFHADDDSNVKLSDNENFVNDAKRQGKKVTFVRVPTGNHYDSMIREGIPAGIVWMKAQIETKGNKP